MSSEYYITFDTHSRSSDACVKTARGKLVRREHLATTLPALRGLVASVPHPRHVCFEEGPLAGWLYRGLLRDAERVVVCDPRRNAYVGKDGDKDDPIDAEKLNDLFRAGLVREVHQSGSAERAGFKQWVSAYHAAVADRVGQANRLIGLGKRWGLLWRTSMLTSADAIGQALASAGAPASVGEMAGLLCRGLDRAVEVESALEQRLVKLAKADELMSRIMALPGYGPVRAATLVAYLDTPWRFRSREALWKYCGIGLRRARSGDGPEFVKVEQQCNRLLRDVVIGAAHRAAVMGRPGSNAFADRYRQWLARGISPRNARRNAARAMVSTIWSMWKTGRAFRPRPGEPSDG